MAATVFLSELINRIGETRAKVVYEEITREYLDHLLKHANAVLAEEPASSPRYKRAEAIKEVIIVMQDDQSLINTLMGD